MASDRTSGRVQRKNGAKNLRKISKGKRGKENRLTPEMMEFVERAIVPALVKAYLKELDAK